MSVTVSAFPDPLRAAQPPPLVVRVSCHGWRYAEPASDLDCATVIPTGSSGYCECQRFVFGHASAGGVVGPSSEPVKLAQTTHSSFLFTCAEQCSLAASAVDPSLIPRVGT